MANNRLFLVYKPTGDYVALGKRMGWGWYTNESNLSERINEFFNKAEIAAGFNYKINQDDFALAAEVADENCKHILTNWDYDGDGRIKFSEKEKP